MIIYVLVNSIEERVYVGQTTKSLEERVNAHWHAALKENMNTRLCKAIRTTPQRELWETIVLQVVYDVEDLDRLEQAWIDRFDSCSGALGYNGRTQTGTDVGRRRRRVHDDESVEMFKEWGRRGAAAGKAAAASMTPERREQFREWGRLGAARAKARRASPKG